MYAETCEATQVRGEQSAEVLDLRMGCLGERLSGVRALGDVFMTADSGVVDNAVGAASALPTLDRCADVPMLRAVIKPPDDPAVRAKVAAVREQVARVKALGDSGQCEQAASAGAAAVSTANAVGYLPLEAEAHLALGRLGETCISGPKSITELDDAVFAADASRHDQVSIEASLYLGCALLEPPSRHADGTKRLGHGRSGAGAISRTSDLGRLGWPMLEAAGRCSTKGISRRPFARLRRSWPSRRRRSGSSHFDVAASALERRVEVSRSQSRPRGRAAHTPQPSICSPSSSVATAPWSRSPS